MAMKYIGKSTKAKNKTVYHVDPECYQLKSKAIELHPTEIEYHGLTCCSYCDPETPHPQKQQTQSRKHLRALKEAANE